MKKKKKKRPTYIVHVVPREYTLWRASRDTKAVSNRSANQKSPPPATVDAINTGTESTRRSSRDIIPRRSSTSHRTTYTQTTTSNKYPAQKCPLQIPPHRMPLQVQVTHTHHHPTAQQHLTDVGDPRNSEHQFALCAAASRPSNPSFLRARTPDHLAYQTPRRAVQIPRLYPVDQ